MVEATNIDDAAQQACIEAGKWFPRDGGFIDCDIAVDAVPKEYYERLTIFANLKRPARRSRPKRKEDRLPLLYRDRERRRRRRDGCV
jgi:hypothetical protein